MRITRSLLLACCLSGALHAAPLTIMVEDAAAPWSNPDGSGYANSIVREAFNAAGVPIKLIVVPYARCKASVLAGEAAACFNMSWEPAMQGRVTFASQPIFVTESRVYAVSNTTLASAGNLASLPAGSSVGLVYGYEYPDKLNSIKARVSIDYSNSESIMLKKLLAGRIQYAVLNIDARKTEALVMHNAGIDRQQVRYLFTAGKLRSYIGFSTRHPQGEHALQKFNQGMRRIHDRIDSIIQAN
ncbi:ABC transporter substrate-binding protein [Vogesella sp. LIG4]|uniref:substrate-binding periplasmic protein n=1 Tax=Vogesella sp. LIG4 TaxID=1192162 RepID=UPI00081FE5D8|nr:transporter substrate-binding domain-containing protein [Vogesella sp. LIG4]SCK11583.1 polar amino acid transport system substrate-binding protein [Vogesella sp. LIG4]